MTDRKRFKMITTTCRRKKISGTNYPEGIFNQEGGQLPSSHWQYDKADLFPEGSNKPKYFKRKLNS